MSSGFDNNPYTSEEFLSTMRSMGFQVSFSAGGELVTMTNGSSTYTINTRQPRRSTLPSTATALGSNGQNGAASATHNHAQPSPLGSLMALAQGFRYPSYPPSRAHNSPQVTVGTAAVETTSYGTGAYSNYQYNPPPMPSWTASLPTTSPARTANFGAQNLYPTSMTPATGQPAITPNRGYGNHNDSMSPRNTAQHGTGPASTTTTASPPGALNYSDYLSPESSFSSETHEYVFEEQKRCHCGCDAIDFCEDCYSLDCHHVILSWGIEEPRPTCIRQLEAAERQDSTPALRSVDNFTKYSKTSQLENLRQASLDASSSGIQLISSGVKVSLLCPITMKRMVYPARLKDCEHLQCFDAQSILQVKDQKDKQEIRCPVCRSVTLEESCVLLNELTEDILADPKTQNAKSVVIRADGSWIVDGGRDAESSGNGSSASDTSFEHRRMIIDVESNTTIMESDSD